MTVNNFISELQKQASLLNIENCEITSITTGNEVSEDKKRIWYYGLVVEREDGTEERIKVFY